MDSARDDACTGTPNTPDILSGAQDEASEVPVDCMFPHHGRDWPSTVEIPTRSFSYVNKV